MTFPLLGARSAFSIGESLADPETLVQHAHEAGLSSILLCDTMTISGMPELFTAAKKVGIKPMIGVRLRVIEELHRVKKSKMRPYYLRAIILDQQGWTATLSLLSLAFQEDHFYNVPRLLLSDVMEAYRGGGVALTLGDAYGALQAGKAKEVSQAARDAGIPLYADLMPLPTPLAIRQAREALLLQDEGIQTLICPPAFYATADQADSLDLMRSIASNFPMDYMSARHDYREHVVAGPRDLVNRTLAVGKALEARYGVEDWKSRLSAAMGSTRNLPHSVKFDWDKQAPSLPVMAPDEFAALVDACKVGWKARFGSVVFGHTPPASELPVYQTRLKYELGVIRKLGFSAYFLLVAKVVKWAKGEGIMVGPGRGSIGGSLIAYLMGISDVDPIRFGLLFERFINEDRLDLPDADLDFASMRREEVVEFIVKTFGEEYVAGVVNYSTMQAAGALNDTCRMLKIEAGTAFSKLVPKEHGQSMPLAEALEEVPELAAFAEKNPEVIRHALNLEGRIRSYGKHAAGLIVAGVPIRERAVIERRNGSSVVNWDKRLVEDFGLVKMDILGLSTLDMMDISVKQIKARHGITVDLLTIALDDPATLVAFGEGTTTGTFQFESPGMRRLLRSLAQSSQLTFDDLAIATALYRPGPMDSGLMDDFVKIRQGTRLPTYDHPSMEAALAETKGVMIFQEGVMAVARDFAGYTMPEADNLRKIMGKKQKDKMALERDKFIAGVVAKHGADPRLAEEIFEKIAKFAAYGFNKSHATAYAMISYQAMWLKVNYPAEFWSGVLTMVKEDRRNACISDMTRMGIKLMPPDVNESTDVFSPLNDAIVLMPFSAIKGLSEKSAKLIVAAREEGGKFTGLEDFATRAGGRGCNVTQRANLDKVGGFSRIVPGQEPADHHSRRRDQADLLPGLIADAVVIDRELELTGPSLDELTALIGEWKACTRCELAGLCHPRPYIHGPARAMIVMDGPSFREEAADEMGAGQGPLEDALEKHGLKLDDVYITSLIKSVKPVKGKPYSNKTMAECPHFLNEEIRILKPSVIVVCGSLAFKHFSPGTKGGITEAMGKVVFDKEKDCNILYALNPASIFFSPEKQELLDAVIEKMVGLLPAT